MGIDKEGTGNPHITNYQNWYLRILRYLSIPEERVGEAGQNCVARHSKSGKWPQKYTQALFGSSINLCLQHCVIPIV